MLEATLERATSYLAPGPGPTRLPRHGRSEIRVLKMVVSPGSLVGVPPVRTIALVTPDGTPFGGKTGRF